MKNFIWHRNPKIAYENPYEYEAQEQFVREANEVLNRIRKELEKYNRMFTRDDKSVIKAIWMLSLDATDSLLECLELLLEKRHKIAGRLIRDSVEVLDLAALFFTKSDKSVRLLSKWYNNEVVPNREYRYFVKNNISESKANELKEFYHQLSKINHRTYRSLAYGYILGKDNHLVYDGFHESLIYPGVISMYYSLLANMIQILSIEITKNGLITQEVFEKIWIESIEKNPVEQKFLTNEDIYERYKQKIKGNELE